MFSRLLQRAFGGVGDLLAAMIGLQGPGQPDTADIAAAVGMMEAAGLPVDPPGEENTKPPPLPKRRTRRPPPLPGRRAPGRRPPPIPGKTTPTGSEPPEHSTGAGDGGRIDLPRTTNTSTGWGDDAAAEGSPVEILPRRVLGAASPDILEGGFLSEEIFTPESSNVYSFRYDYKAGILYVTYKAPGPTTETRTGKNTCTGKEHTYGARAHHRGPTYAYGGSSRTGSIAPALFEGLVRAASKGRYIWDNLRVCGSIHGHQVPYSLVSSSPTGGEDGGAYTPRKATRKGFRVRTVPEIGSGKRRTRRSNLPEKLF